MPVIGSVPPPALRVTGEEAGDQLRVVRLAVLVVACCYSFRAPSELHLRICPPVTIVSNIADDHFFNQRESVIFRPTL